MNIIEKLQQLGFKVDEDYMGTGKEAYVFRTLREAGDRFTFDFTYYEKNNKIYINCHFTSETRTINEAEVLENHNECNTFAKEKWLEIKEQLKDYEFNIFSWY